MSQLSCSDTPHTPRRQPSPGQTGLRVRLDYREPLPLPHSPNRVCAPTCPRLKGSEDLLLGVQMCSLLSLHQGLRRGPPHSPRSPHRCPPLASPDLPRCAGDQRTRRWGEADGEKPHFEAESLLSKRNHPTSSQASRNVTATDRGESCLLRPPVLSPTCLHRRAPRCRRLWPPLRGPSSSSVTFFSANTCSSGGRTLEPRHL